MSERQNDQQKEDMQVFPEVLDQSNVEVVDVVVNPLEFARQL